ncbi:MAG: CHASE2 domain-containing protein [Candidatus Solibacter sp.]
MRVTLIGSAVAVLVVSLFLVRPGTVERADEKICDVLSGWVSRGTPSGQIVLVEIDEPSLAQVGRWPWPRDVLARLVSRLLDRGAATVVLNMVLHEEDRGTPSVQGLPGAANDEVLAGALSGKPVVLGHAFRFEGPPSSPSTCPVDPLPLAIVGPAEASAPGFFHPTGILCSTPALSKTAAAVGFLNGAPDADGELRRVPLLVESGEQHYPSLALAAFTVYRHATAMQLTLNQNEASQLRVGTQAIRLEGPSCLRLRFRGPRRTFPYLSAAAFLNDGVAAPALQGKIAIVGGSALGLPHPVATPVDALLPDLEVQATAIDNLLQGDSFNRPAGFHLWELSLALLCGLGTALLLARVRPWSGALLVLGTAAAIWAGCTLLLSATGLLFSPLPVTAVLACQFPAVTMLNYWRERRRAERSGEQLATAQEYSREILREGESRFQRLVENVNDAIIVDDLDGRLIFANRRFREWFSLQGKDIRQIALEDFVAPEWRAMVRDQHTRRVSGQSVPGEYEFQAIQPDGTLIWLESLVTTVQEDEKIVGTQAALRDVTGRKRMEALYLQAQKMEGIGRLAGGVAHDFNNLLTVINGYSDLLLSRMPQGSANEAALKQVRAAGERATELTRNLLALSRKQLAQPKVLDLNVVVNEVVKMFDRLLGEDIELKSELSPELAPVVADSGQLHQILMNLLVNARDAMPHGGKITIQTKNVETDEVCLRVSDSGSGMSDEIKRQLFEPFFTTKEPGRGTGLGLATVDQIVRQSAGRIEVTTKLGTGTAFDIYLPRAADRASVQPGGPVSATDWQGSETVLIVDDQAAVVQYIRSVLEDAGYQVLLAANGADALELEQQYPGVIHLLLTDIVLPRMNGIELSEKMRVARPGIRLLFTSGYAEEAFGSRGIIAGELTWLPKPFVPSELLSKVREALT